MTLREYAASITGIFAEIIVLWALTGKEMCYAIFIAIAAYAICFRFTLYLTKPEAKEKKNPVTVTLDKNTWGKGGKENDQM